MIIPADAEKVCRRCGADILKVRTARKSKGEPLDLYVNPNPDRNGTVYASVTDGTLYGDQVVKSKRAALLNANQNLYMLHACTGK